MPPAVSLLEHFVRFGLHGGLLSAHRSCSAVMAGQLSGACLSPGILVAPLKTPTVPPATTTNTFLVGSQKVYVIDPATPDEGERRRLFDLCDRVESEGASIAGVLLTHHHWDHVGSAAAVAERYSVAVGAHPESLARLDLGAAELREVNEGDEFDLGTAPNGDPDWTLRAIFTPGHAPGHLAFIESSLRGAIVGDLVSTLSSIVIDPPEGHMETYLASLRRLIDEDIRVLHPAHGLPTRDGVEVVRGYLEHRAERERKLLGALGPEPLLPSDLVATLYCDTPAAMHGYAERSLLAGLIKLREQGQARETANGWLRQR
ncbi:MAG: ribonuclease/clavin/mitogillin [Planctomycetota bacterium]